MKKKAEDNRCDTFQMISKILYHLEKSNDFKKKLAKKHFILQIL